MKFSAKNECELFRRKGFQDAPRTWNKANLTFTRHTIGPPGAGIGTGMQIGVADLNADKRPDIAVAGKSGTWIVINEGSSR